MTQRVVIHRGSPRWLEIRGRRYDIYGGDGPDQVNAGWGYEVCAHPDATQVTDGLFNYAEIRAWAQDWLDHPEWGWPEDDDGDEPTSS